MKRKRSKYGRFVCGCVGLLSVLFLCACGKEGYRFYEDAEEILMETDSSEDGAEASESEILQSEEIADEATEEQVFYVHICGAIARPGVYCVSEGSRLYEVILLAGGMTTDAADTAVNQAQKLTDGMQVYIPTKEEVQTGESYAAGVIGGGTITAETDTRVDINTADLAQLCTPPGIGETRARAILSYRAEHGTFQSVEVLMNVTGIKAGVYEKIKNLIRV